MPLVLSFGKVYVGVGGVCEGMKTMIVNQGFRDSSSG